MPLGSILGSVIGAGASIYGANKAAKAQQNAAKMASNVQLNMYRQTRQDLSGYRGVGQGAITSLAQLYGLATPGNPGGQPFPQAGLDAFTKSPDYQFALQEGLKGVQTSRAARGQLHSGGTLQELQERGSGLASQNFGNYVSRLLQLAGIGESAAAQTGSFASSTARGIADTTMAGGEAAASGIVAGTNAVNDAIGNVTNSLSLYKMTNPSGTAYTGQLPRAYSGAGLY